MMLDTLKQLLRICFDTQIDIIPKERFEPDGKRKFFPINHRYVLIYNDLSDPKRLVLLKRLLQTFLSEYEERSKDLQRLHVLKQELQALIRSNERFFSDEGSLEDFFSFLYSPQQRYALLENFQPLLVKGLDRFTIHTTKNKLKKFPTLNLPYKNGEIFAIQIDHYIFILQSETKVDRLYKDVIRSRLLWLNALYMAKMGYAIDSLTGLYTRSKFLEDLATLKNEYAFLFINIKDFKIVNELYTSIVGDRILKQIAQTLKELNNLPTYRIYGDRFVKLFQKTEAESIFQTIELHLQKPLQIHNHKTGEIIRYRPDLTMLLFEHHTEEMLEKSNYAFKKGSDRIVYEHDIEPMLQKESLHLSILQKALKENKITPFFQKIVDTQGSTVYHEALLRIEQDGNFLSPVPFLGIAKEKGYYRQLNLTMIQKAIQTAKKADISISLNIDIYDILQKDFLDHIRRTFERFVLDPKMVQFEILETEDLYQYLPETLHTIQGLKELGCSIALDDFGKGYSNFSLLQTLPIDTLKIDMSLLSNIHRDTKSQKIVQAIIDVAKGLGIHTTAEGIDTQEVFETAKKLGIDYFQGFYFSQPRPLT